MAKQLEHKLHGLINTIVQSVRDKSIDIHHVFSKDFAIEHGYDESNRQVFLDQLRNNWYDSLPYINSVAPEDYMEEFGYLTIADGTKCDGVDVACCVMLNIFANFLITGEMYLQKNHTNILRPNILFDPDDMWEAKTDFLYQTAENEIIQFSASSKLIDKAQNIHADNSKTDLMQLFGRQINEDEDNSSKATFLGIYGIMASLIYAMFADAARRKIVKHYWLDEDSGSIEELTTQPISLSYDDLPANLHIPYEEVNEAYFDTAFDAMQTGLRELDGRHKKKPEYTFRKMLDIELHQREHLNESPLWRGFPDKVQQMLLIYLDEHITFLCEKCGIEEPAIEQTTVLPTAPEPVAVAKETTVQTAKQLPFFVPERFKEVGVRTIDEFTEMYHDAIKGRSKKLGAFLKLYGGLGVLDIKGLGKDEIFKKLKAYFGEELKYGYANFTIGYKGLEEGDNE